MKVEGGLARQNRVVIDTNVWLSAALSPHGTPAKLLQHVLSFGVPVFSDATFIELATRIWKPKFDRYLSMTVRHDILHDAKALSYSIEIPDSIENRRFSQDKDDDKFIHAALAGSAMWLVTGDQDLLVISDDIGVRIISPADAMLADDFCPPQT